MPGLKHSLNIKSYVLPKRIPCPWLPYSPERMSYRDLCTARLENAVHYVDRAYEYANYLWQHGTSARAILALIKGVYADSFSRESEQLPSPFHAYKWMLARYDGADFLGNPRISFYHQAHRMPEQQAAKNRDQAWAFWYLTRKARPTLPADEKEPEIVPDLNSILQGLQRVSPHLPPAFERALAYNPGSLPTTLHS